MKNEIISEISIIDGRLLLKPQTKSFAYIYRSAMKVNWDDKRNSLCSPLQGEDWSYFEWFKHMHAAVLNEYGCFLQLSKHIIWNNIPDKLKIDILEFYNLTSE